MIKSKNNNKKAKSDIHEEVVLDKKTLSAINAVLSSKGNPTINDVAEISGVSKKTVSRIINNSENVKSETRAFVKAVVEKLSFKPNPQARALALRRSFLIGMIYDNPNAQYVVNMQMGVLDALAGSGYELVVHPCSSSSQTLVSDVENFVVLQRLSGVIILPPIAENKELLDLFDKLEVPYVRVTARSGELNPIPISANQIVSQDAIGCYSAAEHLVKSGHTKIGFIRGNPAYPSSAERASGFISGLEENGVSILPDFDIQGDYTFESGYRGALKLLSGANRPSAIIASNDEMAAGVYKAAYELGLRIPDDLSVVGFDDSPLAARLTPALTTVNLPSRDMAKMAAKMVMNAKIGERKSLFAQSSLVLRNSTKAI